MENVPNAKNDPRLFFRKQFFFIIVKFVILFVFAAGAIYILSRTIRNELITLATFRGENQWLFTRVNVLADLNTKRDEATALVPLLREVFPSSLEIPVRIIPLLRSLSTKAGIGGAIVTLNPTSALENNYAVFTLTINGSGTLNAIHTLFSSLETERTVMRIASFSINEAIQRVSHHQFTATLKVYTPLAL